MEKYNKVSKQIAEQFKRGLAITNKTYETLSQDHEIDGSGNVIIPAETTNGTGILLHEPLWGYVNMQRTFADDAVLGAKIGVTKVKPVSEYMHERYASKTNKDNIELLQEFDTKEVEVKEFSEFDRKLVLHSERVKGIENLGRPLTSHRHMSFLNELTPEQFARSQEIHALANKSTNMCASQKMLKEFLRRRNLDIVKLAKSKGIELPTKDVNGALGI